MRGVKSFAMVLCVSILILHSNARSHHLSRLHQKRAGVVASNSSSHQKTPRSATRFTSKDPTTKVRPFDFFCITHPSIVTRFFSFPGATPLSQLNPKKKIFETIQPGFITLDTREAAWINPTTNSVHKIRTKDGVCVTPTLVGASLS